MELRMKIVLVLTAILALSGLAPSVTVAQHGMPGGTPMTFFVTSEPIGDGGNLGGLAGADAHCQKQNGRDQISPLLSTSDGRCSSA